MTEARAMRRNISLSYFSLFFYHLFFMLPVWYEYETMFATPAMIGLILAFARIIVVVLELPTGAIADLIGRKKTIFLGTMIMAAGWTFLGLAQNMYWLWIGYFIHSVGVAFESGSSSALYYDSLKILKREKLFGKVVAKQGVILRVAITIAAFLGGTLFGIYFRLPYLLVGLATMISALIVLWYREPAIDSEVFNWKNYVKQTKLGFKQLSKSKYLKSFTIYYLFVGGFTWYFTLFVGIAFATEVGFDAQQRSVLFGLLYLFIAVSNFLLVKFRLVSKRMAYVLFPVMIVVGFLFGVVPSMIAAVVSIFLVQTAGVMRFSILDQYANDEFESKYRATATSALNMLVSFMFVIFSILGGQVITRFSVQMLMVMLGVLAILTLTPSTWALLRRQSQRK